MRLQTQSVVPVAITSKNLMPTRSAGPVVLSHMRLLRIELTYSLAFIVLCVTPMFTPRLGPEKRRRPLAASAGQACFQMRKRQLAVWSARTTPVKPRS